MKTLPVSTPKVARGEIVIRKGGQRKPVATRVLDFPAGNPAGADILSVRFNLPGLAPGVYRATAKVYDAQDTLVGQAQQIFIRYDHAKDLPWLGAKIGVSDQVLPPWTPVTGVRCPVSGVRGKQVEWRQFSVWGRDYVVDGSGLFSALQVATESGLDREKRNILAGPVRVEAVQDGKAIALTPDEAPSDVSIADHQASWKGVLTGAGWRIETAITLEYDGYALHRLRIIPPSTIDHQPSTISGLRLVIPLKPEEATSLHAVGGQWFRSDVSSIALNGDGELWNSGQAHGLDQKVHGYGVQTQVGDFRPYVWIGGPNRGLAFMADNDQGWVPDDKKAVHAIEVVREGDHVNLVLNLVARPFTFTQPREIRFSLQATPIRPLAPDFRDRVEHLNLRSAFTANESFFDELGTKLIFPGQPPGHISGGMHGSVPYPIDWNRFIGFREKYEKAGSFVTPYQSWHSFQRGAETVDPRTPPGKQGPDVAGYLWPFSYAGALTYCDGPSRPEIDYRLYCYQAWIKHGGLKGIYFDLSQPMATANVAAGGAYLLDLPDRPGLHGRVQPGYKLTNYREFGKRLRTLFVENGEKDPMIWVHDTDGTMISAFAFVGAFLDGENLPRLNADYPWFSKKYAPERMQAVCNPAKLGIPAVWLSMFEGNSQPMKNAMWRSLQGYSRLYDFCGQANSMSWAPFDAKKPMTFLPYWDPQVAAALKTDAPNIMASAYRQDNKLQVFVFNRSDQTCERVQVQVDAAVLGLQVPQGQTVKVTAPKGWNGFAEPNTTPIPDLPMDWKAGAGTSGTLTLSIGPQDYRIILIEAQDNK